MVDREAMRVAWIGTGVMGSPMCEHLLDAGYPVKVFSRTKERARSLVEHGAQWCASPAEASEGSDLVVTMVDSGQTVVAGFSTHPHWDHLLWHARLGAALRYGTARWAASARYQLSDGVAQVAQAAGIPEQVPLDLLGLITGLPAGMAQVPWDGPHVRIVEHQGHAPGHAALLIDDNCETEARWGL